MYKMTLAQEKQELKRMETEFNIKRLEVRLLELDEEKEKVQESIDNLKAKLEELDNPKIEDKENGR